jgi:uncharacterized protein YjbI with pentapeptide repeats
MLGRRVLIGVRLVRRRNRYSTSLMTIESGPKRESALLHARIQRLAGLINSYSERRGASDEGDRRDLQELFQPVLDALKQGVPGFLSARFIPPLLASEDRPTDDSARRAFLLDRVTITPDPVRGVYPLGGLKLVRGDILLLLDVLGGPLDLRGANLDGADLRGLDLRNMQGGLSQDEWIDIQAAFLRELVDNELPDAEQRQELLAGFDAIRRGAAARFVNAILIGARLTGATLDGAILAGAQCDRADLSGASLVRADLRQLQCVFADFRGTRLCGACLDGAEAVGADFTAANLQDVSLRASDLRACDLRGVDLTGQKTRLDAAELAYALLDHSTYLPQRLYDDLRGQTAPCLGDVVWGDADVTRTLWNFLPGGGRIPFRTGEETKLVDTVAEINRARGLLSNSRRVARRLKENGARLNALSAVGATDGEGSDEAAAEKRHAGRERLETERRELQEQAATISKQLDKRQSQMWGLPVTVEAAIRANRQLRTVMRDRGLGVDAAAFGFRAQTLQRAALRRETFSRRGEYGAWFSAQSEPRRSFLHRALLEAPANLAGEALRRVVLFGAYAFSVALSVLAGYGYKPARAFGCYLFVLGGFAALYAIVFDYKFFPGAVTLSVSAFHGRGFAPSTVGESVQKWAAVEAILGLFVEVSFIATFTKRFFEGE